MWISLPDLIRRHYEDRVTAKVIYTILRLTDSTFFCFYLRDSAPPMLDSVGRSGPPTLCPNDVQKAHAAQPSPTKVFEAAKGFAAVDGGCKCNWILKRHKPKPGLTRTIRSKTSPKSPKRACARLGDAARPAATSPAPEQSLRANRDDRARFQMRASGLPQKREAITTRRSAKILL